MTIPTPIPTTIRPECSTPTTCSPFRRRSARSSTHQARRAPTRGRASRAPMSLASLLARSFSMPPRSSYSWSRSSSCELDSGRSGRALSRTLRPARESPKQRPRRHARSVKAARSPRSVPPRENDSVRAGRIDGWKLACAWFAADAGPDNARSAWAAQRAATVSLESAIRRSRARYSVAFFTTA